MGIPVIPSNQPTPVVQPAMTPFHLPAEFTGLMGLRRTTRLAAAFRPFPAGYGRLNPPLPQSVSEISAVIALIGTQAGRAFLGTSLRPGHTDSVHHLQPYGNFRDISCGHQESQGQSCAFGHQVNRAAFAFPAIGNVLSPFLAGTKLPSRKAWLQSNFPCWSKAPRKVSQICSHTPWSCHPWRRRWQVEGAPYLLGRSRHLAPERSIQRMPLMVRRSSALGRPRFLGGGSNGAITSHWSSRRSPSITQASLPQTWVLV